jgi:ATP-dependent Clp protease adaptor protein ClpS
MNCQALHPGRVTPIYTRAMANNPDPEHQYDHGTLVEASKPEVLRPPLYQVVLLNDDFTPMDFVVEVLQVFFALNREKATQIMLHVHTRGKGVCGVYTREVAESKVSQVNEFSRMHQHPLLCSMEKA